MTLPNFSEYVVPGVYWNASPTPTASLSLSNSSVVAIVGPAIGYFTETDQLALATSTPVPLGQTGVNVSSVVVTSLDGTTTYVLGTDYELNTTSVSPPTNDVTTIENLGGSISNGQKVSVSYNYTNASYYEPNFVSSVQAVAALYGQPVNQSTGAILSPLSFAAQFALNAGASQLLLVATPSNSNGIVAAADLVAGYNSIAAFDNVDIIVPLPVGIVGTTGSVGDVYNVVTNLSTFLNNQQNVNDVLQVALVGYETSVANATSGAIPANNIAAEASNKRVLVSWPNQMNWYNGYLNNTLVLPGYYLAATMAGTLAKNPVQQGLTRQTITGFSGIPSTIFQSMSKSYKDQLSGGGVAVVELSRSGVLWCRHGTTTDTTSVYTREVSLVRSQDAMIETLESSFTQSAIIGTPIGPNTLINIQGLAISALNALVDQGVIYAYNGVTVTQSSSNPTIVNITFQYQPSYPLNYITFTFSVNTSTGSVVAGTSSSSTSS